MASPATPSSPSPAGDDRNLVAVDQTYIAPTFEEKLRQFWGKNQKGIIALCVIVLLGILGKGAWELIQNQRENGIAAEYAAATTTDQLKNFAASHDGHMLAGVAHLRIGDEAFAAGKSSDAATQYTQAAAILKTGPLAARAQVGAAISKLISGDTAGAESALKTVSNDLSQPKAARAEATYHLAALASKAGRAEDVQKFSDQIMTIDPQSLWAQRALVLRASTPAPVGSATATTPTPAAPSVSFPGAGK